MSQRSQNILALRVAKRYADLAPPLGYPGGSCYLIQRVREEVKNPKLADELVEDIEDGMKLNNNQAAKIYDLEGERPPSGTRFRKLLLTPHAQYRMDQRGITVPEVRLALKAFHQAWAVARSASDYQAKAWDEDLARGEAVQWKDPKTRLVVVFVGGGDGRTAKLVTAYWDGHGDPRPVEEESCSARLAFRYASAMGHATEDAQPKAIAGGVREAAKRSDDREGDRSDLDDDDQQVLNKMWGKNRKSMKRSRFLSRKPRENKHKGPPQGHGKRAREWPSQGALDAYLKDHPRAQPDKHFVQESAEAKSDKPTIGGKSKGAGKFTTTGHGEIDKVGAEIGVDEVWEEDTTKPEDSDERWVLKSSKPLFGSAGKAMKHFGFAGDFSAVASMMGLGQVLGSNDANVAVRMWGGEPVLMYEGTGPNIDKHLRKIEKDDDGDVFIHNLNFSLKPAAHGGGIGTKALYHQVSAAKEAGVSYIKTSAAKYPEPCGGEGDPKCEMNGYYTWPRLGYDGLLSSVDMEVSVEDTSKPEDSPERWGGRKSLPPIEDVIKESVKAGDLPKEAADAKTVQEIMSLRGGADWWKKNGRGFHATFDLESDEPMQILEEYIDSQGARLGVSSQEWMDMPPDEVRRRKQKQKQKQKKASPARVAKRAFRTPFVPGVQTYVTQDSKEGLPDGSGEEKPSLSPLPETATPGGTGRDIGTFSYNGPSSDSDIKPRTLGVPGEEYGHPTNVLNNYITRRTIEGMAVRVVARHKARSAATFKLDVGMPVLYGKYKNKKGIIKGFKTGPKGDPIVIVDQVPNPTGRKQPKEIKLFRIRYDKERAEGSAEAKKAAVRKMLGADFAPPVPKRQRRQRPTDKRLDHRDYIAHKQRKRLMKRYYHMKCKRNRNCMRRRELYRQNPKRFKRKPPGKKPREDSE